MSDESAQSAELSRIRLALENEQLAASTRVRALANGAFVIDVAGEANRESVAAALRMLAGLGTLGYRTVAVLGEFDAEPADFVEEHDAIGRLIVRLNVAKLVAVGHGARHLQSAAGLEGSWDGESVIVDSSDEAYDLLREEIRGNDVVLVKATAGVGLEALADRLAGGVSW